MRHYKIQLVDSVTGKAIITSGGKCYVATAGDASKVSLLDADGAAATNPSSLTRGVIEFYVADSVASVDLFIQAPSGHFVVAKGIVASGPNTIYVDKSQVRTTMVIPFSISDTTATTETDTGFDLPTNAAVLAEVGVDVLTLDATETIDIGILSTESGGDANGFATTLSVGTAVTQIVTLTNGAVTAGVLLNVQDSANAGDLVPEFHICDGTAKSISYTLTAGTDTAEGFIKIPLQLPYASL